MPKRLIWLIFFMVVVSLFAVSCSGGTTSTSVDGAKIEMGYEHNDDFFIASPQTSFVASESFLVSFDNNAQFGADEVTIQVDNVEMNEYYGHFTIRVDPQWNIIVTDPVNISEPGKYKVSAIIGGQVRATQDIIIN